MTLNCPGKPGCEVGWLGLCCGSGSFASRKYLPSATCSHSLQAWCWLSTGNPTAQSQAAQPCSQAALWPVSWRVVRPAWASTFKRSPGFGFVSLILGPVLSLLDFVTVLQGSEFPLAWHSLSTWCEGCLAHRMMLPRIKHVCPPLVLLVDSVR